MDLDRYLAIHRPAWQRLSDLSAGGRRHLKRRSTADIDELVTLYQRAATDLSYVRTYYRDPALVAHLTRLVSRSGHLIYGTKARTWRNAGRFFSITFPAAVYRARRFIAISALLMFLPALAVGGWISGSDRAAEAAMPPALRDTYLHHDFEEYYESERASQFASHVFTNNVGVAILAFASGIALCVPTAFLLITNGANVGFAGGMFTHYGEAAKFWGLIAPHGLLELSSVVIAGAAGLQLGWSIIDPGDRPRREALAEEARRAVVIVMGLVLAFGVAGTIEGFVTGQPWPTWLRVGIGVIVEVAFVVYCVTCGRTAHRAGFTGALGEHDDVGWARLDG